SVLPAVGAGEWRIEQSDDEWAAAFYDAAGKLSGFALLGKQLQHQRSQWVDKLNITPAIV
ncbi:MAG: rubredoxin-NAD(+) reductase, partial [Pseudomonadota bacterium]|nr:rubredoxin-NAD(+) reductase [Pseudomonadota bacterium]